MCVSIARFQHPSRQRRDVSSGHLRYIRFDGLPADGRAGAAAPHGARVRRSRDPPARHGVGRGAAFPDRAAAEAGRARADGHPVPRGVRRRGDVGGRLLHLHRGAGARRSGGRAVGGRAQRPVLGAHRDVRHRRAEAAVPAAAGARRGARRVGADRAELRQRRRRHADDGRARRRRAGCSTARRPSSRTAASAT